MSQEWSLTPAVQQPVRRKGRGALITGVVLLVVALVMGVVGVVGIVAKVGSVLTGVTSPEVTPTTLVSTLDGNRTYVLYELASSTSFTSVSPGDVTVAGPGGEPIGVTGMGITNQTFTSNGDSFTAVAQFTTGAAGPYTVDVATDGATVMLGPSLGDFIGLGLFGILIGLAVLVGIVAIVLLVVGLVRRSSSGRTASPQYAYGGPAQTGYVAPTAGVVPPAPPVQPQYPAGAQTQQPQYPAGAQTQQPQIFEAAPGEPAETGAPEQAPQGPARQAQPAPAPQQQLPPAGWYPDPGRPGGQRYWDGARWTEHQA